MFESLTRFVTASRTTFSGLHSPSQTERARKSASSGKATNTTIMIRSMILKEKASIMRSLIEPVWQPPWMAYRLSPTGQKEIQEKGVYVTARELVFAGLLLSVSAGAKAKISQY
ncbi:MAG: hypothetical protein ACUVSA_02015 [Desulfosoma sp.]|uniref:hypothetical protein n=1 Tax=Desulfosoma sp. TaxID=2603217 RepID=UPI00404B86DD